MSHDLPVASFTLTVSDVFRFSDGSTVFVGTAAPPGAVLAPARVDVVAHGRTLMKLALVEERSVGPKAGARRMVATFDPVDPQRFESGCVLVYTAP